MLSKIEKKLLGVKRKKIKGVTFEIKKVTPEDYLDKEGLPISKWQPESETVFNKQKEGSITLQEIKKIWRSAFLKSIVSIDKNYNVEELVDKLIENYFLSAELYNFIGEYSFGIKKKLFQ